MYIFSSHIILLLILGMKSRKVLEEKYNNKKNKNF